MFKNTTRNISFAIVLLIGASFVSCRDTLLNDVAGAKIDESNLVDATIAIKVNELHVSGSTRVAEPSDIPEEATEQEKKVDDIWVFQYDATNGNLLIKPRYYIASESEIEDGVWNVALKSDVSSYIYVVTNTQDHTWASNYESFNTMDMLKQEKLNDPRVIVFDGRTDDEYIPMEGVTESAVVPNEEQKITVPVTRMYAKLKIKIKFSEILSDYYEDVQVSYVNVASIPYYCRVGSLANDETATEDAVAFPTGTEFQSKAFEGVLPGDEEEEDYYPYVLYVPENLGGENENEKGSPTEKGSNYDAPKDAISITARITYKNTGEGEELAVIYVVYPGGNNYNNFNIRRNDVYRISLDVGYPLEETPEPSANCICGFAGETLVFYPYYREETGGNGSDYYNFSNHLNPNDEDKKINTLKIIWQTEGCIGDNAAGDKVSIKQSTVQDDPVKQYKIYVKTAKEGNALIGAYNSKGDIIWSWHIWVRDNTQKDPTNIANAMTYYTYEWDSDGIYPDKTRVLGYPVMNCNIGALVDEPASTDWADYTKAYGTIYQWGRKDPFPPCKHEGKLGQVYNYDEVNAHVVVYDNENKKIDLTNNTGMPGSGDGFEVFNTILTTSLELQTCEGGINYSIQHPTVFIAAAKELTSASSSFDGPNNYINQGDWLPEQDDYLWGGTDSYTKKYEAYTMEANNLQASLRDNYGEKKTIFDPCPYGWRTAPGDIWLGFTSTGKNVTAIGNINCTEETLATVCDYMGYHFYMQGWKRGQTSFFPTQGSRIASGQSFYGGICGNYHNATADEIVDVYLSGTTYKSACKRVDILHVHAQSSSSGKINIFEDQLVYYNRAVAGPVRCVRETK